MRYPRTPDGRYFVAAGRLWRCTDPALSEPQRKAAVKALMIARRAVREAGDEAALAQARAKVHEAKVALGERGPVWWSDGTEDYGQRAPANTPYAEWWRTVCEENPDAAEAARAGKRKPRKTSDT